MDEFTQRLWHDTAEEALEADILAAGGMKDIGTLLWPTLREEPQEAGKKLRRHLNREHEQKFSQGEVSLIVELAAKAGSRCYAAYIARLADARIQVVAPEDQQKELLERYDRAKREVLQLAKEMGVVTGPRA